MLANPTVPEDIQRLLDAKLDVTIDGDYLIVSNVPYIAASGGIERGEIISPYNLIDGVGRVNGDHTVWFTGSVPHDDQGRSLERVMVADTQIQTIAGRAVQCRLSNKPDPIGYMLDNFYNKMMHYVRKLEASARSINDTVSASATGAFHSRQVPSVFHFPNTAIASSGLDAYEAKLKLKKVAIIGCGGTGAYILDGISKTPIWEIHLFDHDVVEPKNAYRWPGGMTIEEAHSGLPKVEILKQRYGAMRTGIQAHPVKVDGTNIGMLDGFDFVFCSIDHGPSRGVIAGYLADKRIPFIDVGIGVDKIPEIIALHARARVTLVTPKTTSLVNTLPVADDAEDAVYNNIQLAELNALNAMLAIIRFKQYLGFYTDEEGASVITYRVSWSQLSLVTVPDEN